MNPYLKIKHLWRRMHLMINHDYYPEFLRKQGVRIGKNCVVLYPSYFDGRRPYLIEIGDDVVISLFVTILTHDATSAYAGDLIKIGRVVIQDHCFIGANSIVLCNVNIGPNSIVGAGSVVSRDIPPDSVYAGNPAKFICSIDTFIEKHKHQSQISPMFEARHFKNPNISDMKKTMLTEKLRESYGYCCAQLPAGRSDSLADGNKPMNMD